MQKRAKRLSRKNQHGADWRGSPRTASSTRYADDGLHPASEVNPRIRRAFIIAFAVCRNRVIISFGISVFDQHQPDGQREKEDTHYVQKEKLHAAARALKLPKELVEHLPGEAWHADGAVQADVVAFSAEAVDLAAAEPLMRGAGLEARDV